jgi:hypothetical protein
LKPVSSYGWLRRTKSAENKKTAFANAKAVFLLIFFKYPLPREL